MSYSLTSNGVLLFASISGNEATHFWAPDSVLGQNPRDHVNHSFVSNP
jgi:hypothetical protein